MQVNIKSINILFRVELLRNFSCDWYLNPVSFYNLHEFGFHDYLNL